MAKFNKLKRLYGIIAWQFGIDPRRLLKGIIGIPRYVTDLLRFSRSYSGKLELFPCLHDWHEEGGSTKEEYFWQDLHVARKIYLANPTKHVDIGSQINGFVAHVACFREIEIFDIRPVTTKIPGVVFRQADMMNPPESLVEYCDSLSCLHALEHFGLGRYGDPLDPVGYAAGLKNMVSLLRTGGMFYLSVPVGIERIEFNAHRIFDPSVLVQLAAANNLILKEFAWIGTSRTLTQSANMEQDMNMLALQRYALGIFTFNKQTKCL